MEEEIVEGGGIVEGSGHRNNRHVYYFYGSGGWREIQGNNQGKILLESCGSTAMRLHHLWLHQSGMSECAFTYNIF